MNTRVIARGRRPGEDSSPFIVYDFPEPDMPYVKSKEDLFLDKRSSIKGSVTSLKMSLLVEEQSKIFVNLYSRIC